MPDLPMNSSATPSKTVQVSFNSNIKPWIVSGVAAALLIFGTLASWGFYAPLASAVIAVGQVTVETNRKRIAHVEGGVVDQLLVRNGSKVSAGEVLIRLDATTAKTRLAILRSGIDLNLAQLARLATENNGTDEISFPAELTDRQNVKQIQELIDGQIGVFHARRDSRQGEREILEQRVEQLQEEIKGLQAQLASERERKGIVDQEVESLSDLLQRGLVSQQRVLALRREAVQMKGSIGVILSSIASSKQAIGETRLQIIQGQKDFHQEVLLELGQTRSTLKDQREQYVAAAKVLEAIDIIAPSSGTVVDLNVHAKGAVVRPGEPVLEIVPDNDRLLIETEIQPQDVDSVSLGQEAQVRFSAFKQRTTPLLDGKVAYIAPDITQNRQSGLSFYTARISVGKDELDRLGDNEINPGMPAEIMITTGSRTPVEYIVQPIIDSMNRAWREE